MDKVSIIIPMYNAEKYIEKSIRSALDQTYENVEVIVVDDGSTDGSLEIAKKYSDRITLLTKTNGGTASALNMGIQAMTGQWFKWLSADDLLKPHAVSALMDAANKIGAKAKSYILYASFDVINEEGDVISTLVEKDHNELSQFDHNVELYKSFRGNAITSLMHKSIFEKCGMFDESLGRYEDAEFQGRCCVVYKYRLHLIPENVAQSRIHSTQLSKRIDKDVVFGKDGKYMIEKVFGMIPVDERKRYEAALKDHKPPFNVRVRNEIISIFPEPIAFWIISTYVNLHARLCR